SGDRAMPLGLSVFETRERVPSLPLMRNTPVKSSSRLSHLARPYGGSVMYTSPLGCKARSLGLLRRLPRYLSARTVFLPSCSIRVTRRSPCSHRSSRPWESTNNPLEPGCSWICHCKRNRKTALEAARGGVARPTAASFVLKQGHLDYFLPGTNSRSISPPA